ncbi:EPIDERMAL PATTERNING FACTOR-like protein 6 [Hirschfeldia incana]|nr:EPIDERMAL PATTERNING FACTOR-like protein 6 [Hirschfeldia incana]KAJ0260032.1 EPIDERMAL PATTERNING FACTOR-like protein 6 [Hirschfeldia incana]
MGLERPSSLPSSEKWRAKFIVFYIFLLCVVLCAFTTFITSSSLSSPYIRNSKSGNLGGLYAQEDKSTLLMIKKMKKIGDRSNAAGERRILRGLGSSPPRCSSKCGRCTPCKPVHVPVPPGTPVTAEYYPEAWRCKCGNKLYMP